MKRVGLGVYSHELITTSRPSFSGKSAIGLLFVGVGPETNLKNSS